MANAIEIKERDSAMEPARTSPPREWIPTGIAVAALMSAMLGMLALAVVNVFTAASKPFKAWVHGVGKLWMPGAQGIGPYSGKETLALLTWLVAWLVLHFALRHKNVELSRWVIVFLVGVAVATTLIWPPVFEHLAGH